MDDEQRDPQAQAEAIAEALRPLAEFSKAVVEAFSRAAQAWLDQNRPAFEALAKVANDPAVRAYMEARERGEIPPPEPRQPCHCFCGYSHPGEYVCDGDGVTTRRFTSHLTGPVDVALCAPCAVTQGLAELGMAEPLS